GRASWVAMVLLVLAGAGFWWRRRRKAKRAAVVEPIPERREDDEDDMESVARTTRAPQRSRKIRCGAAAAERGHVRSAFSSLRTVAEGLRSEDPCCSSKNSVRVSCCSPEPVFVRAHPAAGPDERGRLVQSSISCGCAWRLRETAQP